MKRNITMWTRLSELRSSYLMQLDRSSEIRAFFGEAALIGYESEKDSLSGFIKFCKNYKITGFNVAILGKNHKVIKVAYGK